MRVLMVSCCLHSDLFGGVQRAGQIAWKAIASSRRFAHRLLCYGSEEGCDRNTLGKYESCAGSRVQAVVHALRRRGQADIIFYWHLNMLKLRPLLGSGTRTVVFLHGIECWRRLDLYTRRALMRVDHFFTNSSHTWDRFLEYHPDCRAASHQTVHLGIEKPAGPVGSPRPRPAALIIGRMDRRENYKGHAEIINAWPAVLRRLPDVELWIVGSGNLVPDFQKLASARNLDRSVRFFGAVSDQEKLRLLQDSRCFLMPSRGEGFGLVYLEAMRLGRPCLVSPFDAGHEVVNPPEAGLAADPADNEQLTAAIIDLLQPGLQWDHWSAQARRRYEHNFTARHFQHRMIEALASIAA